jgi:uroporphyrinogen decarboxylase
MREELIRNDLNILRAIRFEHPDYIPMTFHINDACHKAYPAELLYDLMEGHKFLFPDFVRPSKFELPDYLPTAWAGHPYTDMFGCVWQTNIDGIVGSVVHHPLADWAAFADYTMPDPAMGNGIMPVDWEQEKALQLAKKAAGHVVYGGLRHGHTFLQLCDLRGYENLLIDMVEEEPRLFKLIEQLETFNMAIVQRYIDMGCTIITYAEDLGMQVGPMLSPVLFRKYIKPSYERLIKPAKDADIMIHMHSDGDIRLLARDLIEGGVEVINLQDLVNGIDWIAGNLAGKVCVDLDIDRQQITARGTPKQIDDLIREEVTKIGKKEGGLSMIYGLYPGVPVENVRALMDAMERYAFYYS